MKKVVIILMAMVFLGSNAYAQKELTVYSARKSHLIKPIFEAYEKETGVKIKFLTDKAGPLLEKLKAEGDQTEADILITVDAGNLWHAAKEGILDPVESDVLQKNIPAHFRDPNNQWFGFSVRARTIIYNTTETDLPSLVTYEGLADPIWKGQLCLRTSKKVYNQSLVAMMIAEHGVEKTEEIVRGWVSNLAAPVFSNDTKVIEAVAAGQCNVGIVNTYYYGRWLKNNKSPHTGVSIFWPNQSTGSGVHVNVSGAGIVKASKHKEDATLFLEWLSGKDAQKMFADVNLEYPANAEVKPHESVALWGPFDQNIINVTKAGELQTEAVKLMDRAGYK